MRVRVISSLVGLIVLFCVLALYDTILLNIAVAVIGAMCVYELLGAIGYGRHKFLLFGTMALVSYVQFLSISWIRISLPLVFFVYIVAMCVMFIIYHTSVTLESIAVCVISVVFIASTFAGVVSTRDSMGHNIGLFYTALSLGAAWGSDTGAYFVGINFGKRKLAPDISPKKTVEGALGGIASCIVCLLSVSYAWQQISLNMGYVLNINYIAVALIAPLLSMLSVIGDLTASAIKRQYGVKDFGNIMPGHGGVLDRFDSALMTLAAVYILSDFLPLVIL